MSLYVTRAQRNAVLPAFAALATHFNNSTHLSTAAFDGQLNSKRFTFAGWFRPGDDGVNEGLFYQFQSSNNKFSYVYKIHDPGEGRLNTLFIRGINAGNSLILSMIANNSVFVEADGWSWFGISVDMADPAKRHMYRNDSSILSEVFTYTDDEIDFTAGAPGWFFGANGLGSDRFNGDAAEIWFDIGTYIDFSVTANRRKFISATGKPVSLGDDGANVTGVPPLLFLSGESASWNVNKGSGGGMNVSGSLSEATTSPSD